MGADETAKQQESSSGVEEGRRDRAPQLRPYRWKPGQSGNPKGRVRGRGLTDQLLKDLDKPVATNAQLAKVARSLGLDSEQATIREVVLLATLVHAMKGNATILKELWDRVDGKVADRIAGHDGGPLVVQETLDHVLHDPEAMRAARELANRMSEARRQDGETEEQPHAASPSDGSSHDSE